ncbi:MAG: ribonuclease J [Anaerolineales bacterium]|nr:ribonuclease J [Anaerolineales bacterium]
MSMDLRILPLGGLGEVGKNMMLIETPTDALIVDAGLMFPENDMLGIDYIIPDFNSVLDRRARVRGIVVTHGHEDHTGAIDHVVETFPAPIYATPLTSGLLEVKLSRAGLQNRTTLNTVRAGEKVQIGPFGVEFFHVCHSIPDGVGLGITTPSGLIVHSGDFKFDHTPVDGRPTDYAALADFSKRGVLALLSDSTNADRPGWTPSEAVIDSAFDDLFRAAPGRILIGSFASLISRIQQAIRAAERHGRRLALVGTSMQENAKMAQKLGYLEVPNGLLVSVDEALKLPSKKVVLMTAGTQGEPSSILGRLATGRNRQFDLEEGDTVVFSSHPIPGNEEMVHRTINRLFQRGARVIYDPIAPVHVSGHANAEEMKLLIHLVQPEHFIPIHGELRQLHQHGAIARGLGIPAEKVAVVENGYPIEFEGGAMRVGERVPGEYIFVDGRGVGDIGPAVMRERERLARDGFVIVRAEIDPATRRLAGRPEILSRGFVFVPESGELLAMAEEKIREIAGRGNGDRLAERIESALTEFFYRETKRRPMIFVLLNGNGGKAGEKQQ